MAEENYSNIKQVFNYDSAIMRLDLYRLMTYFLASKNLAALSTDLGYVNDLGNLKDDFERDEITRILIQTAVVTRM